jgi:hypothetical protein
MLSPSRPERGKVLAKWIIPWTSHRVLREKKLEISVCSPGTDP